MTDQTLLTALKIQPQDNVATCIRAQSAGELAVYASGEGLQTIRLLDDIPFGHKVALCAIPQGGEIFKYGAPIGIATKPIPAGAHVHIHNVGSLRCSGKEG